MEMAENVSAIQKLLSFVANDGAIGAGEAGAVLARSNVSAVGGARSQWEASQEDPASRAGSGRYFAGRRAVSTGSRGRPRRRWTVFDLVDGAPILVDKGREASIQVLQEEVPPCRARS
ncbi:hypothetical protein [Caulobacter sp. BK020]|uniref:hypothetical protein n=1 Tax=Caulobacter sp. BK020 TaxID=2512117 RepID=UPI00104E0EA2|nr:hypothetical protein [Caulobacter sp. BK020]